MIDNLEHGWIVDGIPQCDEVEVDIHCFCCGKILKENYTYKGFGKYYCEDCEDGES